MKIKDVLFSAGKTGFFFVDQSAIKKGARQDGFIYIGQPVTEHFERIRQAGESISVILILENGQIAVGDCAAVPSKNPAFIIAFPSGEPSTP